MTKFDHIYKDIVLDIINNGKMQKGNVRAKYADGTPAYTKYIHGVNFVIEPDELPILQSKRVAWKTALVEMEWIWQEMSNDLDWLQERDCHIWDEWEIKEGFWNGTIGKAYGYQLRDKLRKINEKWFNQVEYVIHQIKNNPRSRRILTTLYNVEDLKDMALEPCVYETQWEVDDDDYLILHVRQRSADMALGSVINVLQYSVLHRLMAKSTGKKLGNMYWNIGNAHIYDRHLELLEKQVTADISELEKEKPVLNLPDGSGFFESPLSQATIKNYHHNGNFKYEVAI